MPKIEGVLREVSADSVEEPETGRSYYTARIAVDANDLPANVTLLPGMPAEVLIDTGTRTLLEALLDPVTSLLRRGLRER